MGKIGIIAETAFTHRGDFEYLKAQIRAAADSGVDWVKFQIVLNPVDVYAEELEICREFSAYKFSDEQWEDAFRLVKNLGMGVVALPVDYSSIEMLASLEGLVDYVEIHSICLNDLFTLKRVSALKNSGLILGVGGHTVEEVALALQFAGDKSVVLMAGFQSFPTKKETANLRKIRSLAEHFALTVGYADHTPWDQCDQDMLALALGLGAQIVEKHIILQAGDSSRPDYYSAVSPAQLSDLSRRVALFDAIMGSGCIDDLNHGEVAYRNRQRQICATENFSAGHVLKEGDLRYMAVDVVGDIPPGELERLYGQTIGQAVSKNGLVKRENV